MAERTNIPGSPACGQWETLLADALDGTLRTEDESTFSSHMAGCAACTALFEEARRGREWLDFLSAEPELPEGLLERILAQTGPGQAAGYGLVPDTGTSSIAGVPLAIVTPKWQKPGFLGLGAPLCRAPPDDDRGHGVFLDSPHPEPDRRQAQPDPSLGPEARWPCGRSCSGGSPWLPRPSSATTTTSASSTKSRRGCAR